ncbi:hypothetical protein ACPV3A_02020 [Paenibacillus sp. Dod16]|nr:hypothetical protein [Paenibacillus glucanolyticus]OMF63649.1 hypothetical protein BK142_32530 [Paenibacillus glucanolyticus]
MKVARTVRRRGKGGDRIKPLPISINFAIIFVLILLPFVVINSLDVEAQKKSMYLEAQYNAIIDTAAQDAASVLLTNSEQDNEARYESPKNVRVNKEEAARAFFNNLYINFGVIDDPYGQGTIQRYIPAFVVIGYDGYYIYSEQEYLDANGDKALKHVWSQKKPYSYKDKAGNIFSFTLDDYITVYQANSKELKQGYLFEIDPLTSQKFVSPMWVGSSIPLIHDTTNFDNIRRQTIVSLIQSDLEYEINKHNNLVRRYGVSYTFTLPSIDQEEWDNTIDDVGVLAFVQGIPVGTKYYNNFALGGARIIKKQEITGITVNGTKYYYDRSVCKSGVMNHETFISGKEAAANGYHPLSCLNK